jgi:hypothetical protein
MVARPRLKHDPSAESKVEVMLDVFSGRPNPCWTFTGKQVDELKERLRDVPRTRPGRPPGLGYRGVVVTNLSKDQNLPDQVRAHDSVLSVTEGGRTTYCKDINRIEDWLLDKARALGYGDLIEQARRYK